MTRRCKKPKPPKISVLMPIYNGERFLREAIESILAQTMPDFEFIIVDDGSDDGSWSIVQGFKDSRIRAYQRPHAGLDATLNFGLSVAQTNWIARMDHDDVSLPDRFERQLEVVAEDDGIVVVGGQTISINEDGKHLDATKGPENHEDILRNTLYGRGFTLDHSSVLMRKDAMVQVGGYRARLAYADDIDLWLRLSDVGTLRALSPPAILLWRRHSGSMCWHDDGRVQCLHGLLTRVCYFKRRAGKEDPVDFDDARWEEFVSEIERVCECNGVFRARNARVRLSQHLKHVESGKKFYLVRKVLRLVGLLLREPLLVHGLSSRNWLRTLRRLEMDALE